MKEEVNDSAKALLHLEHRRVLPKIQGADLEILCLDIQRLISRGKSLSGFPLKSLLDLEHDKQ